MRVFLILLLVLGLTLACAQRKVTLPETEGVPSEEEVFTSEEMPTPEEEPQSIEEEELAKIESTEIEMPKPMKLTEEELERLFQDIGFDYDRYDIREEEKAKLRSIADWMLDNPAAQLIIEGHCDERGTTEYNLGLGDRRAASARDYLVSIGVPGQRLKTVSYGEERPVCYERSEACWGQNRRAHFEVLEEE